MAAEKDNAMNTTEATAVPKTPGLWQKIVHFLREVQVELKKTNWPTRDDLTKFTVVVMVTIVVVSLYLFISDQVIGTVTGRLFNIQAPPR